ncbi:tripartite motif-containing protein 45-like [Ostrea edulis]|uniref:tripartite motif-containing protein 45-like n=1 Tax=Ostrea edulis TaxID=37623 RepID=UPI0024AEEE9B|nr:tripartite motif-containing protein 45-like [Ostrea edulis]
MSTSQDIIVCEVCEIEPLQHFCNQCEVRLCNNCVIPHLGSESVEGHTIVRYKYRDARNVKPRQCSTHPTENKTLFCKNCDVQICTKGYLEHLEHEVTDLKQFIHSKYVDIDKDIDFLRTTVQPNFESGIKKLKRIYEKASAIYDQERQRMMDAEKDLQDKVTEAMKTLLDEMETRRNETLRRLTDLKTDIEANLQTLDHFIDKCEAAKTSVEDILTIKFDEGLLDMDHSVELEFPQYASPNKWTVDVGAFKSILTRRMIFKVDVGKDIQLPVSGRVMLEKHSTSTGKNGTPTLSNTKDYISKVIQEFEKDPLYPKTLKEYEDLLMDKEYICLQPVTPFKEESVTAEQREYKPNLAKILLLANKQKFVNAGIAWLSYVYLIGKHKLAVSQQFCTLLPFLCIKH